MDKIFKLVKVMRKCDRGGNREEEKSETSISTSDVTKYLIISLIVIAMLFIGFNINKFLSGASAGTVVQSVFILISLLIAIFAIPKFINTLFMSTDITSYLTLPCKPSQITTAKLIVIAISQYGLFGGFSLPFLIGYGISGGQSLSFWLGSITLIIAVPAIVLSVMGILVMLLMRFVPFARNKDVIAILGVIIVLLVTVAYLLVSLNSSSISVQNVFDVLGTLLNTLAASAIIVPVIPLGGMVIDNSALYLIPVILIIAVAFVALYMIVANAFYLKTALRIGVGSGSNKRLSKSDIENISKQKSLVWAYTVKELKTIFRTPAFILNGVINSFLYPAFISAAVIVPLISMSELSEIGMAKIDILVAMIEIGTLLLAMVFGVSINNSALISISREGQSFFIMKTIPVPYKTQLKAKRNASLIICETSAMLYSLVIGIIFSVFLNASYLYIPLIIVIAFLFTIVIVDLQMIFAVNKPNLAWESDAQLNKADSGAVLYVMIIALLLAVVAVAVFVLQFILKIIISPYISFAIITLIFAVVLFVLERKMYAHGEKKLSKL